MFEVGRVYNRRDDLHTRFGGQRQGGISTPADQSFLMLFTGESGEQYGYRDGWNEHGVFLYTGEGQTGNMDFVRGNRAIRDHVQDGKVLELFESLGKGHGYRYVGQFVCASWEFRQGLDSGGAERRVIVFHLVPIGDVSIDRDSTASTAATDMLRRDAYEAASGAAEARVTEAKRLVYDRSSAVRDYVLVRANGICESCRKPAPFRKRDGTGYLEPHHTRRMADGGPDHPRWVGAVCPNCHCEIHFGESGDRKNHDLQEYLATLEQRD